MSETVKQVKKTPTKKVEAKAEEVRTSNRKVLEGIVVSNKMDKTIVVAVTDKSAHPLYGKVVTRTKKYKAHDEKNECNVGDKVQIMETRPISKDKYFRLLTIVEKVK